MLVLVLVILTMAGCDMNGGGHFKRKSVGAIDTSKVDATSLLKVTPSVSSESLKNPGKGWFFYGDKGNNTSPFSNQALAWKYASVGYCRFNWNDIEPKEGEFDWSWIDNAIEECKENDARFSFGVMTADPSYTGEYVTPKWVFDSGAKYLKTTVSDMFTEESTVQYIPIFDDEIYLQKVRNFADALAERYGNNEYIEFIDIRSYGSWGENNLCDIDGMYVNSDDTGSDPVAMYKCWDAYIQAFKDTNIQLMVAYGFGDAQSNNEMFKETFLKAIENGVGIRVDGFMHYTAINNGLANLWAYKKAPAALEFAASYSILKKEGSWDVGVFEDSIATTHTSYYPIGGAWPTDTMLFASEQESLISSMMNKIGYHFTLNEVMVSPTIGSGENDVLVMKWTNDGNAPIYIENHLAAALLNDKNEVVDFCWLDGVDMAEVTPAMDNNTEYKSVTLSSPLSFDKKYSSGKYKLALGLFTSKDKENPDIKIGNKERTDEGWYIILDENKKTLNTVNYAAFCDVEVSSVFDNTYDAKNITDLNFTKSWSSAVTADEQTVTFDLGAVREINTIQPYWGNNYARQYKVLISKDNKKYTEIYSTDSSDGEEDYIGLAKQEARYVKIVLQSYDQTAGDSAGFEAKQNVNILRNPGYEEGLNSWGTLEAISSPTNDAHSGTSAIKITNRETVAGSLEQNLASRLTQMGPGKYELSAWVKPNKSALGTLSIYVKGEGDWGNYCYLELSNLKGGEWNQLKGTLDISWKGNISYAYLRVPDSVITGVDLIIDDVEFKKISAITGKTEYVPITEGSYTLLDIVVK